MLGSGWSVADYRQFIDMWSMARAGFMVNNKMVDSKKFLYIVNWEEWQRECTLSTENCRNCVVHCGGWVANWLIENCDLSIVDSEPYIAFNFLMWDCTLWVED